MINLLKLTGKQVKTSKNIENHLLSKTSNWLSKIKFNLKKLYSGSASSLYQ